MSEKKHIIIEQPCDRLDTFLADKLSYTRSQIKQLISVGSVLVNLRAEKAGKSLKIGDEVLVTIPDVKQSELEAENIDIEIIYEDDDIALINKPQGMTVHPGGGAYTGTLVNALLYKLKNLSSIGGEIRPGIVHRLDKDTSGLMVVAKNDNAHQNLSRQIADRSVDKYYTALVEGVIKEDEGRIETFIGRSQKNRKLMAVLPSGRQAITLFKVIKRYNLYTLVQFKILTGRTHQIRVHAKHMGNPIVGDKSYGFKKQKFSLDGQLLHASKLSFLHPATKKKMTFTAPLPHYFERIIRLVQG